MVSSDVDGAILRKASTTTVIEPDLQRKVSFANTKLFMLVLTRQEGEKICIGDKIIVEVTHNGSDRVRLGINAPPDKVVLRGELHGSSKAENNVNIEEATIDDSPDSALPVARCG